MAEFEVVSGICALVAGSCATVAGGMLLLRVSDERRKKEEERRRLYVSMIADLDAQRCHCATLRKLERTGPCVPCKAQRFRVVE